MIRAASRLTTLANFRLASVRDAVALAARANASELYLATRSGVIYRSTDGGLGWSAVGAIPAADLADLVVGSDFSLLVLTAAGSACRSTDQGASWTAMAVLTAPNFVSLAADAAQRLYALIGTGEVSGSVDGGTSRVAKGTLALANAVEVGAVGDVLYVMSATGDVHSSSDQAASWTAAGTLSQSGMTALARDGATLLASTAAGEVATSADGASWTWQGVVNQLTVSALATDTPASAGVPVSPGFLGLALGPARPNPAIGGGAVTFPVELERDETLVLTLHDASGRLVARRRPERYSAGAHDVACRLTPGAAGVCLVTG